MATSVRISAKLSVSDHWTLYPSENAWPSSRRRDAPYLHGAPGGKHHSRRTLFPEFARNLRDRLLANGIMTEDEFESCHESLEHHLADPDTLVIWAYFQAWATKR